MDEKELLEKVKGKISEGVADLKSKIEDVEKKSAEFDSLKTKFAELEAKKPELKSLDEFNTLAKECSNLAAEVKALKEQPKEKKSMTFADRIMGALNKAKDQISNLKSGTVRLELKSADVIDSSSFGSGVLQGLRLPGIDMFERNAQTILPEITVINGGPGSDPFSWVEKVVKEGGAAPVLENNAKPLYDWTYKENKVTAETIAAIVAVSKQALLRMPTLFSQINDELLAELRETLQTQIVTGNGSSPALNGIQKNATAFNPPIQQSTTAANEFDVIAAVASQVVYAKGMPSVIGVNPAMFYKLQTTKDDNNQYLLPPFMSGMPTSPAGSLVIAGMKVIPVWDLGADEFLGGDLRKYMFNIVEDVTVDIGWIDDMFQKNQLAVRAEVFGNGGVKDQHKNKIVKGTFTYAKAILDGAVSS